MCPKVVSGDGSSNTGLIIGLSVGLGTGAVVTFIICCLTVAIAFLVAGRMWENRRKEYDGENAEEGMEMGRRGMTHFSYREIDPEDLQLGDMLGEGAFGKVYKGLWRGAPVGMYSHSHTHKRSLLYLTS